MAQGKTTKGKKSSKKRSKNWSNRVMMMIKFPIVTV